MGYLPDVLVRSKHLNWILKEHNRDTAEGHFITLLCEKVSLLASPSWPQCMHCRKGRTQSGKATHRYQAANLWFSHLDHVCTVLKRKKKPLASKILLAGPETMLSIQLKSGGGGGQETLHIHWFLHLQKKLLMIWSNLCQELSSIT